MLGYQSVGGFLFVLLFFYSQLKAQEISILDYKGEYAWAQSRNKATR